jgi:hypothetical protein
MSAGAAAAWEPSGSSPVNRKTPPRRVWMFPFALLGVAVVPLWFRAEAPRILGGVNDFLGIYAGSRLAGSAEQFNADAYLREQVRVTGWSAPSILLLAALLVALAASVTAFPRPERPRLALAASR